MHPLPTGFIDLPGWAVSAIGLIATALYAFYIVRCSIPEISGRYQFPFGSLVEVLFLFWVLYAFACPLAARAGWGIPPAVLAAAALSALVAIHFLFWRGLLALKRRGDRAN